MAAKIIIKIPHVKWFNGEPRFVPSPRLRKLGFASHNLKHPNGEWFDIIETQTFSKKTSKQANERQAQVKDGKRLRAVPEPTFHTLSQLIADLFARPEFRGTDTADGRRRRKALARSTVRDYHASARILEEDHQMLWLQPSAAVSKKVVIGLLDQIESKRGLSQARKVRALLSTAFAKAGDHNPLAGVRMPTLEPRLVVGSIAAMSHFINCADEAGRPDIGDMIMMGIMTGQRQGDRFHIVSDLKQTNGWIKLRQSKKGALVEIPASPQLMNRLNAARSRRKMFKVDYANLCIDEANGQPWNPEGTHYRRQFAKIRKIAAKKYPELSDFHDQDLRDTAVTWMANADCTIPQICSITGHSEIGIYQVLKHYLAQSPEQATAAIDKMVIYLEQQGAML